MEQEKATKLKFVPQYIMDNFTMLVAISTLIFAICTTLNSAMTAKYSNKAVMLQNQASDSWSEYQAKSIKENVSKSRLDIMELFAKQNQGDTTYKAKASDLQQKIAQYKKEEADIMAKANGLQNERDNSQTLAKKLGTALIFLQIGILFSSLSSINKIYYFWYIGLLGGTYGLIDFLSIALRVK